MLEGGLSCGLHRIEWLMRQNATRARPKQRGTSTDDGKRSVIADSILDREFEADGPNQTCPLMVCMQTIRGQQLADFT
jgi:putative transposase